MQELNEFALTFKRLRVFPPMLLGNHACTPGGCHFRTTILGAVASSGLTIAQTREDTYSDSLDLSQLAQRAKERELGHALSTAYISWGGPGQSPVGKAAVLPRLQGMQASNRCWGKRGRWVD